MSEGVAGWYGKIVSLGDFASRRLPQDFIAPWDDWLQRVIAASRGALGEAWLDAYLTSPVWRFLLLPGVCGAHAWAGVLMPSVDRVGRYFPLAVAGRLEALPGTTHDMNALADWFDRLEDLALATLDPTHGAQQFDEAVQRAHLPSTAAPRAMLAQRIVTAIQRHEPALLALPSDDELPNTLQAAGSALMAEAGHGTSLWWARSAAGAGAPLMVCRGLPDAAHYLWMLRAAPATGA